MQIPKGVLIALGGLLLPGCGDSHLDTLSSNTPLGQPAVQSETETSAEFSSFGNQQTASKSFIFQTSGSTSLGSNNYQIDIQ